MSTKLTLEDPVDADSIKQLEDLSDRETALGHRLLAIENEKVAILAGYRAVSKEIRDIFMRITQERGLPADAEVEIDSVTHLLNVVVSESPRK